jgi:hypothetical protein
VAVRSHMEVVIDHKQEAAIHMLVAAIHMLVAADQIQVKRAGSHQQHHLHHNRLGPFVVVRKQLDFNLVGRFEEAFIQGIELDIQVEPVADLLVLHKLEVLNLEGIKVEGNLELALGCCGDCLRNGLIRLICLKAKSRDDSLQ